MSGRKNFLKYAWIVAGDMSGTINSTPINIEHLDNIGAQFAVTGTPTGTLVLQVSNDYNQATNSGTFTTVAGSSTSIAAGSPSPIFINIDGLAAQWLKASYTASSGTGTLNSTVTGKMI